MKILLTAINAKYIHSNLGIYSLKAYGEKILREQFGDSNREELSDRMVQIELAEYTINSRSGRFCRIFTEESQTLSDFPAISGILPM